MRPVLVTGGAGFIGSHLVDRLLDGGASVRVLDNLSTGSLRNLQTAADRQSIPDAPAGSAHTGQRLELIVGDVRDQKLVRRAMRNVDCVFHLAALPAGAVSLMNPGEIHSVNVHGTLNVLQAATAEGVRRVVFASCASVYGAVGALPVSEETAPQPGSVFAASKLAGEIYCRTYYTAHQLETVLLRYFTVYGPRQNGMADGAMIPALIKTLRRQRRPVIRGDGRNAEDFIYVADAVEATLAAALTRAAAGRIINIASGQAATTLEILSILNRLLRTDAVPRLTRSRSGAAGQTRAQISLAAELLGCAPRMSLVAGLSRTVQFANEAERPDEGMLAEVGSHEERPDV
jgi:nucleoside-diphosphate-sugar epimerase